MLADDIDFLGCLKRESFVQIVEWFFYSKVFLAMFSTRSFAALFDRFRISSSLH